MKIKPIATIAAIAFLPITGFAQTPPPPPPPPAPQMPPGHIHEHEGAPKVPVTFLGVETSQVPSVVSEQLGLAKGLGLVVDYVVPDSPAAAAGIQQNDILKMLNDQILIEPSQLRKLLQSFSEGTNVTLTILRKGQEQKITVKLAKKEVPQRRLSLPGFKPEWNWNVDEMGNLGEQAREMKQQLQEQLGDARDVVREAVIKARDEVRRARNEARRANGQFRIVTDENGGLRTTKIDIGKAQIVFSDEKGEMKLETVDGKKLLAARDPQGKLLFSGPIETKEDLDKMPAEVRERYEKLQQHDLPAVAPRADVDEDESADDDVDDEDETPSMEQV